MQPQEQEDIIKIYQRLSPSKTTIQFMEEQRKINTKIETFMATTKTELEHIKNSFETYVERNEEQHKEIIDSIKELRVSAVRVGVIIGGTAVAIVISYLLIKAGLPSL